jgi:hypothetical protein
MVIESFYKASILECIIRKVKAQLLKLSYEFNVFDWVSQRIITCLVLLFFKPFKGS